MARSFSVPTIMGSSSSEPSSVSLALPAFVTLFSNFLLIRSSTGSVNPGPALGRLRESQFTDGHSGTQRAAFYYDEAAEKRTISSAALLRLSTVEVAQLALG